MTKITPIIKLWIVLLAIMLFGVFASNSKAGGPEEYYKASGAWVLEKEDIGVDTGSIAGKLDLETQSDGYGGFFGMGRCSGMACLEIEGGFERINSDPGPTVDVSMDLYSMMGKMCVEPGKGKVRPYLCGGAGVFLLSSSAELMGEGGPMIVNGSTEMLPGFDVSAGLWFDVSEEVSVGLGARYRDTFEDFVVNTSSFGGLAAGVDVGHYIIEGSIRF